MSSPDTALISSINAPDVNFCIVLLIASSCWLMFLCSIIALTIVCATLRQFATLYDNSFYERLRPFTTDLRGFTTDISRGLSSLKDPGDSHRP